MRGRACYWRTQDRLAFAFNGGVAAAANGQAGDDDADEISAVEEAQTKTGYSSGERQLQVLRDIVTQTAYPIYLLDEWDANFDPLSRSAALALVEQLARRARVVDISHHHCSSNDARANSIRPACP